MNFNAILLRSLRHVLWVPLAAIVVAVAMTFIAPVHVLLLATLVLGIWVRLRTPLPPLVGLGLWAAFALAFFAVHRLRDPVSSLLYPLPIAIWSLAGGFYPKLERLLGGTVSALLTRSPKAPGVTGLVLGLLLPLITAAASGGSGWGVEATAFAVVLGAHLSAAWLPGREGRLWLIAGAAGGPGYLLLVALHILPVWEYSPYEAVRFYGPMVLQYLALLLFGRWTGSDLKPALPSPSKSPEVFS